MSLAILDIRICIICTVYSKYSSLESLNIDKLNNTLLTDVLQIEIRSIDIS